MRSAQSMLVKLILAVRFGMKLFPIWDQISASQKTDLLRISYKCVCSILFCVKRCCGNNLLEFQNRWGSAFPHRQFSNKCCSAGVKLSAKCGFTMTQKCAKKYDQDYEGGNANNETIKRCRTKLVWLDLLRSLM